MKNIFLTLLCIALFGSCTKKNHIINESTEPVIESNAKPGDCRKCVYNKVWESFQTLCPNSGTSCCIYEPCSQSIGVSDWNTFTDAVDDGANGIQSYFSGQYYEDIFANIGDTENASKLEDLQSGNYSAIISSDEDYHYIFFGSEVSLTTSNFDFVATIAKSIIQ